MLIVVPTYRRHSNGEATSLTNLPRDLPLTLVVRQDEAPLYQALITKLGRSRDNLWIIPDGAVSGIATTRQWIVNNAVSRGYDKIIMVDDDLKFASRGGFQPDENGWDYRLKPSLPNDDRAMFDWMWRTLDETHHVGVSTRDGNNHRKGLHAVAEATRCIRCVGFRLDHFKSGAVRYRTEVEGREDLDVTLQLLRMGHKNIVTHHWAQDQRSADSPGGLEGVRDQDQLKVTAEALVALHPAYVNTRIKVNKTGRMAGERTEVTVYWKKALENG